MSTITGLMLSIKKWDDYLFYHKDTGVFDRYPVSAIQMKKLDPNAKLLLKDDNNFRFLTYDEINHKDIMRFYVRECVEDKLIRKQLFNILRRDNYVDAFIDELHKCELYEDFDMICGDIYIQIFQEWEKNNGLTN
ncbi:MAG: hypothetical protein IKK03_02450 [Lachnospiraceae bacterium]|nr:hypothetical protein [Lachnospiraceae bacterium]